MALESAKCGPLVHTHKPAVVDRVGNEDSGEPMLNALFGHRPLRPRFALRPKLYALTEGESIELEYLFWATNGPTQPLPSRLPKRPAHVLRIGREHDIEAYANTFVVAPVRVDRVMQPRRKYQ